MIDILRISPNDTAAIGELVDLLHAHCDIDQCSQFLADLGRWNRLHDRTTRALEASDEWREIMEWQRFITSLPRDARRAA